MALTSLQLIVLIMVGAMLYYTLCKRHQWELLLVISYVYYLASGYKNIIFIITTTVITYIAARCVESSSDKGKKRLVLIIALLADFSILAVLKYTNLLITTINQIADGQISLINMILPLGISFYTFQSTGYILDVYWGKTKAEKNFFKLSLFVSYFPQIMQGPISRFDALTCELFKTHKIDARQFERAAVLILYGLFKKLVFADNAAMFVDTIFGNYLEYDGLVIAGVLGYSIQLYGDFSGGIDIVRGISYIFGVELVDNFRQPYFARSITDFWHRWHITLGTWMKDYVFYPVTLSGWMKRLGKSIKKKNKKLGRTLPICIANIIVFLVVGVWHGSEWKFIIYGLYNGIIIGFSGLMAENYRKWKSRLNINDRSKWFVAFQILRTFILVNISWLFDRAYSVKQAFIMFKNMFTRFNWMPLIDGSIYADKTSYIQYRYVQFAALILGFIVILTVSILKENKVDVREKIISLPWFIRGSVYAAVIIMLPLLGMPPDSVGGFIYAQF